MTGVAEVEQVLAAAAEKVGPSVVRIGRGWGRGAGIVVQEGRVLTNAHNLRGEQVTVGYAEGRSVTGHVRAVDAHGDLAVIEADTAGTPAVDWNPQTVAPRLGQVVVALANPGGLGVRVTLGVISAVNRQFQGPGGRRVTGGIEHTAPLGRGSSGGPLLDVEGNLIGLNTHRLGDGFYIARTADEALAARVADLGKGEVPQRRRLGVGLAPGDAARRMRQAVGLPQRSGALVRVVEEGSPADRAGIRTGDLIVRAGAREIADPDDLYEALEGDTGGTLELSIVRGAEELVVTVSFEEPEAPEESGS